MTQTATIILPNGYASPEEFAKDCGFELASENSHDALVKALDGLLGCGNAVITAIPAADDPQSQEAFDMYDDARKRARAALASIKERA